MNAPIIRPAQERDRAALESIALRIGNGWDYLPRFISDWLNDPTGEFFVVEVDSQVVGTGKLTRLSADEWWLEGLRVDPDFQGRGIGSLLHQYALRRASEMGSGVLRLTTDEDNTSVQRMARKTGFAVVGNYLRYETSAYAHQMGADEFRAFVVEDVSSIRAFLKGSAHYQVAQHSTLARMWKAHRITDERLQAWIADQRVYGWQRDSSAGMIIISARFDAMPEQLEVIYADAAHGGAAKMLRAVRGLAKKLGFNTLRYMVPVEPDRLVAVEQAGWRRPKDNGGRAVLFARELINSQT
ncbi:MAG: GNAT family N-acetyltransferase [Anaerolineae bacterium]|nr:GNAT family N-acetyltransferase [Anaerolineae bacterium]